MGSKTASGESREQTPRTGNTYVDSIIGCAWVVGETGVDVPEDAAYYIEEDCRGRSLLTFYRSRSMPDLWEVPAGWRGRRIRFRYQL